MPSDMTRGHSGTLTPAENQSLDRNCSKPKSKALNLIEMKQESKPKSHKPTGGLMTYKASQATQKTHGRNRSKNGHSEHQKHPKDQHALQIAEVQ
jgi:hypothetical protein